MEGTLYIILDSRSLFTWTPGEKGEVGAQSDPLVSGKQVWDSVFQFSRLYNLKCGKKRRLSLYVCDSKGEHLIFDGFISSLSGDVQGNLLDEKLAQITGDLKLGEMKLSPTISKCLCKINSNKRKFGYRRSEKDRIILVDASCKEDYINQYVSLLNCGFASQKLDVVIDVLSVSRRPSTLLNNLVEICRGLNLKYSQMAESLVEGGAGSQDDVDLDQGLTPFLIFHLLPSPQVREDTLVSVNRTKQTGLAVCFCHHEKLEIGYGPDLFHLWSKAKKSTNSTKDSE
ncbi:general transcription factor IIH polypeptide 3 GTF2H3 [Cryptosporidium felis]|nr:general transcription factor IIH polypeptide 3 GTF2H3 [Cryptosporidium felis]